jgi:hypothetical protein
VIYDVERHAFPHYKTWRKGKCYFLSKMFENYPREFVKKIENISWHSSRA